MSDLNSNLMFVDCRVLTRRARKLASQYSLSYGEQIPVDQLVQKVANVMQEFTQSGYAFYVFVYTSVCYL